MTAATAPAHAAPRSAAGRGLLRTAVDRIVAAREAQAKAMVADYLLHFDDATLAELGYSRAALKSGATGARPFL